MTVFDRGPEMTPGDFEEFVAGRLLGPAASAVRDLSVTLHEKIVGGDGSYDFDATVRYRFGGLSFLVIVEAKMHKNPIKRELVQVLHQKLLSVGAHKGVMVSTASYQTGAVAFAKAHGIALVTVADDRFLYANRGEEAGEEPGGSSLVALHLEPRAEPGATRIRLMSPDDEECPEQVAEFLLGRPSA